MLGVSNNRDIYARSNPQIIGVQAVSLLQILYKADLFYAPEA